MKVDNIKPLNTNSTLPNTKHISSATPATRPAVNNTQTQSPSDTTARMTQQNTQILRHQSSNVSINPRNIPNMYRPRRLGDRSLSGVDGGHDDVPTMHPDELETVFGLLNGTKKSKLTINIYNKKLLRRLGHIKNIIDSNYEPEDEDEKEELQNVKRKTTSTVRKEHVRDAIEEMIGKDPTNSYIVLENTKRELGLIGENSKDPKQYTQLDKAILEFSKENYNTHGVKIRADVNIANEIAEADKLGNRSKTQFKEWYYAILQHPTLIALNEIRNFCLNHIEFMTVTNLMSRAAVNDKDGEKKGRFPASDPNTIHYVIIVMEKRSKLNSLHHAIIRLKHTFGSFIDLLRGKEKPKAKTGGTLVEHSIPQKIKFKRLYMVENKKLFDAIFHLMQETSDISSNIDEILEVMFEDYDIKIQDIDKATEKFYNLLLIFLRDMPDELWDSNEHRIIVNDILREKLDEFSVAPTPYIKNKFYG